MRAFRRGKTAIMVHTKDVELRSWRGLVAERAGLALPNGWSRDFGYIVEAHFYFDRPKSASRYLYKMIKRPDLDKLVRAIDDALTGTVWSDDGQIFRLVIEKHYLQAYDALGMNGAGVRVTITAVDPCLPKPVKCRKGKEVQ